jgi:hypothetical protein
MNRLFGESKTPGESGKDRLVVYRLAQEHPTLRDELYEFFEDLVLGDSDEVSPDVAAAEERVARWIQSAGLDIAVATGARERLHTPATTTRRSGVNERSQHATRQPQATPTAADMDIVSAPTGSMRLA